MYAGPAQEYAAYVIGGWALSDNSNGCWLTCDSFSCRKSAVISPNSDLKPLIEVAICSRSTGTIADIDGLAARPRIIKINVIVSSAMFGYMARVISWRRMRWRCIQPSSVSRRLIVRRCALIMSSSLTSGDESCSKLVEIAFIILWGWVSRIDSTISIKMSLDSVRSTICGAWAFFLVCISFETPWRGCCTS